MLEQNADGSDNPGDPTGSTQKRRSQRCVFCAGYQCTDCYGAFQVNLTIRMAHSVLQGKRPCRLVVKSSRCGVGSKRWNTCPEKPEVRILPGTSNGRFSIILDPITPTYHFGQSLAECVRRLGLSAQSCHYRNLKFGESLSRVCLISLGMIYQTFHELDPKQGYIASVRNRKP